MKCTVCGTGMAASETDLPFKLSNDKIVIFKRLPVLECKACPEYLIEDGVIARVDTMLARLHSSSELEVSRYAA